MAKQFSAKPAEEDGVPVPVEVVKPAEEAVVPVPVEVVEPEDEAVEPEDEAVESEDDEDVLAVLETYNEPTPMRVFVSDVEIDDRFLVIKTGKFAGQYGHLYFNRLNKLRSIAKMSAARNWGHEIYICENGTDNPKKAGRRNPECVIIGTLYKEMKLKPRALDVFLDNPPERISTPFESMVSDDDTLQVEDIEGRLELIINDVSQFVTGTVVALKGVFVSNGFAIIDACSPGIPEQMQLDSRVISSGIGDEVYVAILSGMNLSETNPDFMKLEMMADYLCGFLGTNQDFNTSSRVSRVIIAGNSIASPGYSEEPLKLLDLILTQLASSMHVDIMSGNTDPSNFTMPQQPLHNCLFPSAPTFDSIHFATNPYKSRINGVSVLGTSGQNVDDILRQLPAHTNLQCLEKTLQWQLVCPTAPDTLPSHPFHDRDPYVIEECPHLYFAGNQASFSTKLLQENGRKIRLVSVPDFSRTGCIVLVNLHTLDCQSVDFQSM